MALSLRKLDLHNWQTCIHLQLAPDQQNLLATNLYSLAEAYVQPVCQPRAIYDGEVMVGFVMYLFEASEGRYWIPRFMIDHRYQGRGYGRSGMQATLDALAAERSDAAVMISITPLNEAARRLYENLGFVDTGQRSHGELVLRRDPD